MSKGELIDSRVSVHQCKLAIKALHNHEVKTQAQQDNELLPTEQLVWLVVSVKKMYPERKIKPFRMCVTCYSGF